MDAGSYADLETLIFVEIDKGGNIVNGAYGKPPASTAELVGLLTMAALIASDCTGKRS